MAHRKPRTDTKTRKTDGSGTIYRRKDPKTGEPTGPWWVQIHIDGRPVRESTGTESYTDAIKHRDKMLAKRSRGELSGGTPDRVTVGELLDDLLTNTEHAPTAKVRGYVIEASLKPFFGKLKASRLTTARIEEYRAHRTSKAGGGVSQATANRELAVLRTSLYLGRKRTPPKVLNVPYFPMVKETNIRQGFLEDAQYTTLRDELPQELKPLFVVGYATGARLGELLQVRWAQVDFDAEEIVLRRGETKNSDARVLPFLGEDMGTYLRQARDERDANYPDCVWVFNRRGERIKDFRAAWDQACQRAGVPDLHFHDLRRTAVRNLRRVGIPQVVRMKISGHKTDSMERRYSIVDQEDFTAAKAAMLARKADTA